ncbi:MAG: YbjN domain-containing protein [archaeon]|nr:YbjN domain-containing protein [archaeon]
MGIFKNRKEKVSAGSVTGAELLALLAKSMDACDMKYRLDSAKNLIATVFQGDDLDINIAIHTFEDKPLVAFDCPLEVEVGEEHEYVILKRINELNSNMHFGEITLEDGRVWYRYHYSVLPKFDPDNFLSILRMVVNTIDDSDGDMEKLVKEGASFSKVPLGMYF